MCPSIENEANPIRYLGKHGPEECYVFVVNLDTPGNLKIETFDSCLEEMANNVERIYPQAASFILERARRRFKWIGFDSRLVVFQEGADHIGIAALLEHSTDLIVSEPLGAGRLTLSPGQRCFHGMSSTLLDAQIFTKANSENYKLRVLPEKLGTEHFTYEQ